MQQDPRVLDAMLPYQVNYYGNPHSRTHAYGWESESAMEKARKVSFILKKKTCFTQIKKQECILLNPIAESFINIKA